MRHPFVVLVLATVAGCTCGRAPRDAPPGARDAAAAESPRAGLALAAPIAAVTTAGGALVVAGVDAERRGIAVARLDTASTGGARAIWRVDLLAGVSAAAMLQAHAVGEDVALFWRGPREAGTANEAMVVTAEGRVRVEPFATGSQACAAEGGIVWTETSAKEDTRVRVRRFDGSGDVVARVPPDREVELVCAGRSAFVLARGDDDLAVTAFPLSAPSATRTETLATLGAADDEEREHAPFAVGDDLGLVRVSSSGALSWRDVSARGAPRPIGARLAGEEDVVAVDASARALVVVTTREAGERVRVRAVHVDRATGAAKTLDLGEASEPGTFGVLHAADGFVVAWSDGARVLARRIAADAALGPLVRAALPTRTWAEAGCAGDACRGVTLALDGAPRVVLLR